MSDRLIGALLDWQQAVAAYKRAEAEVTAAWKRRVDAEKRLHDLIDKETT